MRGARTSAKPKLKELEINQNNDRELTRLPPRMGHVMCSLSLAIRVICS